MGTEQLTWLDLLAFVEHAPPDSAIARARNPDWQVDLSLVLLREIEHGIRVLAWQKTDDADPKKHKPKNYPTRVPITSTDIEAAEVARRRAEPAADPPPLDDVKRWLGWETPQLEN